MLSLNGISGAYSVLQQLNRVEKSLAVTTDRISTGKKVNSAYDDPAAFIRAQGIRGDIKSINAITQGFGYARGALAVAQAGAISVSNNLNELKAKLVELGNPAISDESRQIISKSVVNIAQTIQNSIDSSEFNGRNLIITSENTIPVVSSTSGGTTTVGAYDLGFDFYTFATSLGLDIEYSGTSVGDGGGPAPGNSGGQGGANGGGGNGGTGPAPGNSAGQGVVTPSQGQGNGNGQNNGGGAGGGGGGTADPGTFTISYTLAQSVLTANLEEFEQKVNGALAGIGADYRSLQSQEKFLYDLRDIYEENLGILVDADIPREKARLEALNVQRQLAIEVLRSINQSRSRILDIFV